MAETTFSLRAAATLVVRLADGAARPDVSSGWHWWGAVEDDDAPGSIGVAGRARPQTEPPYKRYAQPERPYFAGHVESVLMPSRGAGQAGRWRSCSSDALLVGAARQVTDRWHIDLIERVHVPISCTHAAYAIVHFSLEETEDADLLEVVSRLRATFRKSEINSPRWELETNAGREEVRGRRPLRVLVERLIGPAHDEMERRSYWVLAAPHPETASEEGLQNDAEPLEVAAFRRALANHSRRVARGREAILGDPEKAQRQRLFVGPFVATVLGRATAVTSSRQRWDPGLLYNLRSFWAEALLMGVIQDDELDRLAARLADLGEDPLDSRLDNLHREWLSFRNRLWWSQLSPVTDVPTKLLEALRREQGSPTVFTELVGDFDSYIAWRRQRSEDAQATGLARLQVYGASFAVVGAGGALAAIFASSLHGWGAQLAVVAGIAIAGLLTYICVRGALPPGREGRSNP
jgi:hypothetical protein